MRHPIIIGSDGKITNTYARNVFQGILSQYLNSAAGKAALTQSMVNPIRKNLDYQGIARKVFVVQPLDDEE